MEFFRQEYWSGLPCPSPGDLPHPWIEPRSPSLQADSLLSEPLGKQYHQNGDIFLLRSAGVTLSIARLVSGFKWSTVNHYLGTSSIQKIIFGSQLFFCLERMFREASLFWLTCVRSFIGPYLLPSSWLHHCKVKENRAANGSRATMITGNGKYRDISFHCTLLYCASKILCFTNWRFLASLHWASLWVQFSNSTILQLKYVHFLDTMLSLLIDNSVL